MLDVRPMLVVECDERLSDQCVGVAILLVLNPEEEHARFDNEAIHGVLYHNDWRDIEGCHVCPSCFSQMSAAQKHRAWRPGIPRDLDDIFEDIDHVHVPT